MKKTLHLSSSANEKLEATSARLGVSQRRIIEELVERYCEKMTVRFELSNGAG